jgi:hypothetical protein
LHDEPFDAPAAHLTDDVFAVARGSHESARLLSYFSLFISIRFLAYTKEGPRKVSAWRFVDEGTANMDPFVGFISTEVIGGQS